MQKPATRISRSSELEKFPDPLDHFFAFSDFGIFISLVQVFHPTFRPEYFLFILADGQVPCSWDPPQFPVRWPRDSPSIRAVTYTANSLHVSKCCKFAKKQSLKPKFNKDM